MDMKRLLLYLCLTASLLLLLGCGAEPEMAEEVETEPSIEEVWTIYNL
jgi:hypothetical protein